jgi:Ca-activated chloride channel family protein
MFSTQPVQAFEWKDLWQTPDQQAVQALQNGDAESAQALFEDPMWRGSAAYKAEDFEQANTSFLSNKSAKGHYNRGNALAKSGDFQGGIDAYDSALSLEPNMQDAMANRALLEKLKEQQEQQEQQEQSKEQEDQNQQNQQNQNQQSQDQQSQDQEESEEQTEQQKSEQEQEQEQEQSDDKEAEEQAAKDTEEAATDAELEELSDEEKQEQQAIEKMLRRIPDDPGGLLRAKFRYQSRQQNRQRKPPTNQERW